MISVICVLNDLRTYNQCLLASIKKQKECSYELIKIDNTKKKYDGAIAAFKDGVKESHGQYLMFVNQDMCFDDPYLFQKVETYCDAHQEVGMVGVNGVLDGKLYDGQEMKAVNSLEEGLFVIPRNVMESYPFDEEICAHWQLYAVEYSYRMKQVGKQVVALPLAVINTTNHALMDEDYIQTLTKIANKYHGLTKHIDTSIKSWPTNKLLLDLQLKYIQHKQSKTEAK